MGGRAILCCCSTRARRIRRTRAFLGYEIDLGPVGNGYADYGTLTMMGRRGILQLSVAVAQTSVRSHADQGTIVLTSTQTKVRGHADDGTVLAQSTVRLRDGTHC